MTRFSDALFAGTLLAVSVVSGAVYPGARQASAEPQPRQSNPSSPTLTFTKDIAPIVLERCGRCHQPGGVAPFSLLTYTDVKSHARLIAAVVRSRA